MSGLLNKAQGAVGDKLGKDSQPGNGVEAQADNTINQGVNSAADQSGVPKKDDKILDQVVDSKVNDKIPGGN